MFTERFGSIYLIVLHYSSALLYQALYSGEHAIELNIMFVLSIKINNFSQL